MPVTTDLTLEFDFNIPEASFDRTGADLTITFESGGSITLEGFFAMGENAPLPSLMLQDGTAIDTGEFLLSMNPDMDIATAMGAQAANASSGAGEYAADAGALLGGVDRLGSLGTDQWAAASGRSDAADAQTLMATADAAGPGGGGDMPYHTRLIVTDTAANSFSFFAVDGDGNPVTEASRISVEFANGSEFFTISGIDEATGKITVTLTEAGLAALQNGAYAGDLLSVSIDGNAYNMPLVINDDQSYNYASEEAQAGLGPDLKAEWYASDSSTVYNEAITLGGSAYNSVDISKSSTADNSLAAVNSAIDVTRSSKSDVAVTAEAAGGTAYGVATYGGSGEVASSIRGGAESNISISASAAGNKQAAYGVFTSTYDGADKAETVIEGNRVDIRAHTESGMGFGVFSTHSTNAVTSITADSLLDIGVTAGHVGRANNNSINAVQARNGGIVNLTVGPEGQMVVTAYAASSDQYTYDIAKGGFFASNGLTATGGGTVNVLASDLSVTAEVGDGTANGTAAAVYAGWDNRSIGSGMNISGHDGNNNVMTFTAKAADMAFGVTGTNSGNVTIQGGDRDDKVAINAEAEKGGAVGVSAQGSSNLGGSKVILDGGAGNDTLEINARFTGARNPGKLDLFEGGRGAYGIAAAWQKGLGDGDYGAAQVHVTDFENVTITADARNSNGYAYGIYSRSAYQVSPGVTISNTGGPLHLTIAAYADDPAMAFSVYNNGGTNTFTGGSQAGGPGDRFTLTGHVDIATNTGKNLFTTGAGNDTITVDGDVRATLNKTLNHFTTGDGDDSVGITGDLKTGNAEATNRIETGAGNDQVHIGGAVTGIGTNTIDMGDGNNTVTVGKGMNASGANAVNTITGGGEYDEFSVSGDLSASGGGKNVINTGAGASDQVILDGAMSATGAGSSNSIVTEGTVTNLHTDGSTWFIKGMNAENTSGAGAAGNAIEAGGAVELSYTNTWGHAYGMNAVSATGGKAENSINAGGNVTVKVESEANGWLSVMNAEGPGATNTIVSGGNVILQSTGKADHDTTTRNDALSAVDGGRNIISAEKGGIMITAGNEGSLALGIYGQGDINTLNELTARDDITITAKTDTTRAHEAGGVYSNWSSTTFIESQAGNVGISADASKGGPAYAVSGNNNTTISALGGDITLSAHGGSSASGLAGGGVLKAESLVDIDAIAENGRALGVSAYGRSNVSIAADKVDITAQSKGGAPLGEDQAIATGIYTYDRSQTDITAREIDVHASAAGEGDVYGLRVERPNTGEDTKTTLTGSDYVTVTALSTGGGNVYGMSAEGVHYHMQNGAENVIGEGTGKATITAETAGGAAAGLYATGFGAANTVHSESSIDVRAAGIEGSGGAWMSRGLDASNSGENELKAKGAITVTSEASQDALGLAAGDFMFYGANAASNTLSGASITVNTSAMADGGKAWGLYAYSRGTNDLEATGGNITIASTGKGNGDIRGVVATGGGSNEITSAGAVSISAMGGAMGRGLDAWGGNNSVTGHGVTITNINASDAVGVAASSGGKNEVTSSGDLTILAGRPEATNNADNESDWASGVWATTGGRNALHTDGEVNITAQYGRITSVVRSEGNAEGGFGINEISGHEVTLTATGGTNTSYGLYADGGQNTVTAQGGPDGPGLVTVHADAAEGGNAYALFAHSGGQNIIQAGAGAGITVTISAESAGDAVGLWASGNGSVNHIKGAEGDFSDKVSITGDIRAYDGGENIIDTGAGNDVISLHGHVQPGALNVMAGEGHDLLVLHAATVEEFNSFYKEWLDKLGDNNQISDMSIEEVHISLDASGGVGDLTGLSWLHGHFEGEVNLHITGSDGSDFSMSVNDFASVTFATDDSLHLQLGHGADVGKFGDLLEGGASEASNLVLNMTNDSSDTLNLDSFLGKVDGSVEQLYIRGDSNDAIAGLEQGGWSITDNTAISVDGFQYYVYNNDDSELTIYIQTTLACG